MYEKKVGISDSCKVDDNLLPRRCFSHDTKRPRVRSAPIAFLGGLTKGCSKTTTVVNPSRDIHIHSNPHSFKNGR